MKKATAIAAIIAAVIAGSTTGITTNAAAQAAHTQTCIARTETETEYKLNDSRLLMFTGSIEAVNHKDDFTGDFTIRSDCGKSYFVSWDPEDFEPGDKIIFLTDDNKVLRVHCYNVNSK